VVCLISADNMPLGVWNEQWGKCDGATISDILDCNFVWPDPGGACWECWKRTSSPSVCWASWRCRLACH